MLSGQVVGDDQADSVTTRHSARPTQAQCTTQTSEHSARPNAFAPVHTQAQCVAPWAGNRVALVATDRHDLMHVPQRGAFYSARPTQANSARPTQAQLFHALIRRHSARPGAGHDVALAQWSGTVCTPLVAQCASIVLQIQAQSRHSARAQAQCRHSASSRHSVEWQSAGRPRRHNARPGSSSMSRQQCMPRHRCSRLRQ